MKKIIVLFSLAVFTVFILPTNVAEAACVLKGEYYSDEECAAIKARNTVTTSVYVNPAGEAERIKLLQETIKQLLIILQQLQALQTNQIQNQNTNQHPNTYTNSQVRVETVDVDHVEDDSATLYGEVDFRSEDEATVYFQYGRIKNDLNYETVHVVLEDNDDEEYSQRVINLRQNIDYYFRAVAEDELGRKAYGSIMHFNTDDRSDNDDEPEVDVDEADDITDDSAEISGEIDMNGFRNGIVFFVYGEDEDQIEDIARDYDRYSEVDEDGDDLQKVLVDTNLDDSDDYTEDIKNLDNDTDIFFALCVEYEDEDDNETIICSDTEEFTTDN